MAKLFLFGVGGTGARVLKAFTMLMASGIKLKNIDTVVPILWDVDIYNGNSRDSIEIMEAYQEIHSLIGIGNDGFFKTKIRTMFSLSPEGSQVGAGFRIEVGSTEDTFKTFLGYDNFSKNSLNETEYSKYLMDLLYSKDNLNTALNVGFLGNPNMGSLVLNTFNKSREYQFLKSQFNKDAGDRIFIVSSVFGGTGAAGFPLLVRNLRESGASTESAFMGAITVLPYFSLTDGEIDATTFKTKSKIAIDYYKKHLGNIQAHYYIGDSETPAYPNSTGGDNQKNKAHFIELMAAMSILHFDAQTIDSLKNKKEYQYGMHRLNKSIQFKDFPENDKEWLEKHFSQMELLYRWYRDFLKKDSNKKAPHSHTNPYIELKIENDDFYKKLWSFLEKWHSWIEELRINTRSFDPFGNAQKDYSDLLKHRSAKKGWLGSKSVNLPSVMLQNFVLGAKVGDDFALKFNNLLFKMTEKTYEQYLEKTE